jgi:CubicO group peptidase (beta-lactamase class C family)
MRYNAIPTALALLVTASTAARAQLAPDSAALVDRIFATVNRTDAPGCVLGIDRGGRALYRRGYGMASLETGTAMTPHSVVESGSVAKQFLAGAIVKLAMEGRISLDDPVRKHVPELPDYGEPITVRMLLNHTSGLRDMWTLFSLAGRPIGSEHFTMDEALRMVFRQRALNFPPNSEYLYSNSGYLLLAVIVERVAGMPLARYSEQHFFGPLGMASTQWRDDWYRVVPGRVTAYSRGEDGGYVMDMPYMSVYGAGGLLTTVDDLLRWNAHLGNPTLLGRAWADAMHQPGRLTSGREIGYALGLMLTSHRGVREVSHTGSTGGYRTYLARWPERDLSIAVLCGAADAGPQVLGRRVADLFLGAPAAAAAPPVAETGPDTPVPTPGARDSTPSPMFNATELATFAGSYYSPELDVRYTLAVHDTALTLRVGDAAVVHTLRRTGRDSFSWTGGSSVQFARARGGRPDGFLLFAGRVRNLRFDRQ